MEKVPEVGVTYLRMLKEATIRWFLATRLLLLVFIQSVCASLVSLGCRPWHVLGFNHFIPMNIGMMDRLYHDPWGFFFKFEIWNFWNLNLNIFLKFKYLKDMTMTNVWRIKPQSHAIGVIANSIEYGRVIVVICNAKISQPNYEVDNSLWLGSPNNTRNCCCSFNTKTMEELDVQNVMKDVETECHVTLCW